MKAMTVFGTRPEAIKMAPVILELQNFDDIETIVCVTGQHKEMLKQVLEQFNIETNYDLDIMENQQTLFGITTKILERIKPILEMEKPDVVIIHGDTTTTFATGLACYYLQIPVAHVEAGLRTNNIYSPFPEEFNRQGVSIFSEFNFAPTDSARNNLLNEGRNPEKIFVTGNTVIDAIHLTVNDEYYHPVLDWAKDSKLILLTTHRRENIGDSMKNIFKAVLKLTEKHKDIKIVFPVHKNPVIRELADEFLGDNPQIKMIEPLDVNDFHNIINKSYMIMTDSGGVQEEAPGLGVPVLVLRDTTERQEGVEAGVLRLVGTDESKIFLEADNLLTDINLYNNMSQSINPYGDGKASKRIVNILREYFN